MSGYRLPVSGSASRGAELNFRFDGRALQAHGGETLAAALLAAGVRVVGRSFKYHRPRGIYGFDLDDPNGLVTCGDDPLALATRVEVTPGLDARAVNVWPSSGRRARGRITSVPSAPRRASRASTARFPIGGGSRERSIAMSWSWGPGRPG
jgi:sarcosine oxidase subunit alpha